MRTASTNNENNDRPHEVKLMTLLITIDQMLDRLRDIHDRCVIHRDIKPENFLFKETEYDPYQRYNHFEEDFDADSNEEDRDDCSDSQGSDSMPTFLKNSNHLSS